MPTTVQTLAQEAAELVMSVQLLPAAYRRPDDREDAGWNWLGSAAAYMARQRFPELVPSVQHVLELVMRADRDCDRAVRDHSAEAEASARLLLAHFDHKEKS